jgi:cob(I)alamin adenosyltransferase
MAIRIYTRKGDDGTTSLWYGDRVAKSSPRTTAYGTIDEAVSAIGLARAQARPSDPTLAGDLLRIQRDLFVAGAELATDPASAGRLEDGISRVTQQMVDELEPMIDHYMDQVDLPPKFVIPGGTELSATLDIARTILRRAERHVVALKLSEGLADETVIRYLNRAADLLFAVARYADESDPEIFEGRG